MKKKMDDATGKVIPLFDQNNGLYFQCDCGSDFFFVRVRGYGQNWNDIVALECAHCGCEHDTDR